MTVNELSPEKLRLECPPDQVGCETSAELGPVDGIIGQDRALKALKFGVEMKGKGFNVYVAGPPITGKRPDARSFLENIAKTRPVPLGCSRKISRILLTRRRGPFLRRFRTTSSFQEGMALRRRLSPNETPFSVILTSKQKFTD